MQNEIPAGTKVGVLMTVKGVTAVQAAEVLAHMDGLVHVDLNGEAVSVTPEQIVMPDAPAPAAEPAAAPADSAALQPLQQQVADLESRVAAIEAKIPAEGDVANPAPTPEPAPAPEATETHSPTDSNTAAASGDAAAAASE